MGYCSKLVLALQGECVATASGHSNEFDCQCSSATAKASNSSTANLDSWMVLSVAGDNLTPSFNVNIYHYCFRLLYLVH